jgi:pimeloyl-ACP methyl ester carboxylesterase
MIRHAQRIALAALLAALTAPAQTIDAGPRVATFHSAVDNSEQPYALYIPRHFDASKKYPLLISLHAEETNHSVNLVQLLGQLSNPSQIGVAVGFGFPPLRDVDFVVACPFARGTMGYQGIAERDVYDVLAEVERQYPIDLDRVYLTGVSMGGSGALRLALTRPDVWAAVAPVCAFPVPGGEELAPNALNLPIRLFHGALDPAVPAASSREWQRRLLDAGAPAEYIEYPGILHNAWTSAYRDLGVFTWFAQFRRNPTPPRVRLVTRSYRYASAYWLRIDGMAPGELASIDASLTGKAAARVETRDVDAFTFLGKTIDLPGVVTIDGAAIRVRAGSLLSFFKADGRWRQGIAPASGKRPGAEGPIAAAVSGPHIYVYGTADHPPPEVTAARRRVAERAADWSAPPYARIALSLEVKADAEVTDADIDAASLVLFGSRETNSLIARFAPRLPLELNPGAADYGLLFIAPVGARYALVSSGLPWWTGAEEANRGGDPFAPPVFRLLTTFKDFILFRGSLANVISEGYFDRNWKVPNDASAARMLATGTVNIRP